MKDSHREVLKPLLSDAVRGVFAAYDTPTEPAVDRAEQHDMVAVLGFSDPRVRGGLALSIPTALARTMVPGLDVSDEDWVGELGNQVLGRVRNQLLRYDLDLGLGTPVVISAVGITIASLRDSTPLHVAFRSGEHVFGVFLETRFEEGFEFGTPSLDRVAVDEGSLMLF